jgi:hypothetical protein
MLEDDGQACFIKEYCYKEFFVWSIFLAFASTLSQSLFSLVLIFPLSSIAFASETAQSLFQISSDPYTNSTSQHKNAYCLLRATSHFEYEGNDAEKISGGLIGLLKFFLHRYLELLLSSQALQQHIALLWRDTPLGDHAQDCLTLLFEIGLCHIVGAGIFTTCSVLGR